MLSEEATAELGGPSVFQLVTVATEWLETAYARFGGAISGPTAGADADADADAAAGAGAGAGGATESAADPDPDPDAAPPSIAATAAAGVPEPTDEDHRRWMRAAIEEAAATESGSAAAGGAAGVPLPIDCGKNRGGVWKCVVPTAGSAVALGLP